jgi:hypothetical protein
VEKSELGSFAAGRGACKTNVMSVAPLVDADLVLYRLLVRAADVVFVKGIFEASDGLCCMFAEKGGDLLIAAPHGREMELVEVLTDIVSELGGSLEAVPNAMGIASDAPS